MKKRKKWILIGVSVLGVMVAITLIVVFALVVPSLERQYAYVREMEIEDIDLRLVNNGVYDGSFEYGGFTYALSVVVDTHQILDITVTQNRDSRYAEKAIGVLELVKANQTLQVDVVSGATTTSKALLKALERALKLGVSDE